MSLEAARGLSIPDLLRLLNEKLGLECTRVREIPLSPAVPAPTLGSEVSTRRLGLIRRWSLTHLNYVDRWPRNQSTGCFEAHPFFTEHVATSQQAAAGAPLLCRSTRSRRS